MEANTCSRFLLEIPNDEHWLSACGQVVHVCHFLVDQQDVLKSMHASIFKTLLVGESYRSYSVSLDKFIKREREFLQDDMLGQMCHFSSLVASGFLEVQESSPANAVNLSFEAILNTMIGLERMAEKCRTQF